MKFYLADSLDRINTNFNYLTEENSPERYSQLSDKFAHEIFKSPPYDGILVSYASVHGAKNGSRYSQSQRFKLMREGAQDFFRIAKNNNQDFPFIGDCGSYSYIKKKKPPITTTELIDFYNKCRFTYGVSPDHIILEKNKLWDSKNVRPNHITSRAEITLSLAKEFLHKCRENKETFIPIGVIQCWSPKSAVHYANKLIEVGYNYIGLGGITTRPTDEIIEIVSELRTQIPNTVKIHLFGFNRINRLDEFHGYDITSFDSTSPILKSFKDAKNNYFSKDNKHYTALRVPSLVEKNIKRKIESGFLKQNIIADIENRCLEKIRSYDNHNCQLTEVLDELECYERYINPKKTYRKKYERVLSERPWKSCNCEMCRRLCCEIIIFRGINRNISRGFHNLYVFYEKLKTIREDKFLEVPCLNIEQNNGKHIYSFIVNGKDINKFASISRIARDGKGELEGYQRPEIINHVNEIAHYLDRKDAMLPNSIVIAFNKPLSFNPLTMNNHTSNMGTLKLPIGNLNRSGWIVDGQQRTAAIRKIKKSNFPVSIIAFESTSVEDERTQFLLVNSAKALPKSLIYELLPSVDQSVPKHLMKRQKAYRVLEKLNLDPYSPFFQRIKTTTTKGLDTVTIQDTSVLKMIENSFENGALQTFNNSYHETHKILCNFWGAVKVYYSKAWDLKPKDSRLTHGVGIISMGYIMDAICYKLKDRWKIPPKNAFIDEIDILGHQIAWTEGVWVFSKEMRMPWNELQNTTRHTELVTNYLIRKYRN